MWCPILKLGELAAKSPAEKSEDHSDACELIWENFTHEEKVNICWLIDSHFFSLYFWTSDFMIYFSTDALSDVWQ